MKGNRLIAICILIIFFTNGNILFGNSQPTINDTSGVYKKVNVLIEEYSSNYDSLQLALQLSEYSNSDSLIALSKNSIAEYYYRESMFNNAIDNYIDASKLYLSLNDSLLYAKCYRKIAIQYEYKGVYDSSITYYNIALNIFDTLRFNKGIAMTYSDIGVLYWNKAEYVKALSYFNSSLVYCKKLKDISFLATVYNNKGLVYLELGDYEKALDFFYKSEKIDRQLNDSIALPYTLNNIGLIHEKMQEYDKALEYYNKCIEIDSKLNNWLGIADTYINMCIIYTFKNDSENALFFAKKSLEIYERMEYKKGIALAFSNLSDICFNKQDVNKALEYNKKALAMYKALNSKKGIGHANLKFGTIFLNQGYFEKAIEHLHTALTISTEIEQNDDLIESLNFLSKAYYKTNNYKKAYEFARRYNEVTAEFFTEEKNRNIEEMKTRFDVENKNQEISLLKKDKELKKMQLEKSIIEIQNQKTIRKFSIVISVIFIFILLLVFNRYKLRQNKTKVQLEKQQAETENRLLRSQMNPHFIFNSLYSIQGFIANNKSEIAENYLVDFASLMRSILTNSSQSFISLDKELESLRLYLKLEQLRFKKKFSYCFEIDENIESEFTMIPPMLIQPFIENSILHGILPKSENGQIIVSFVEHGNCISCSIIDDGIGLEESGKRKLNEEKEHKSAAIEITQNRLNLIGRELNIKPSLNIIDLKDNFGKSLGTKVEIAIPTIDA